MLKSEKSVYSFFSLTNRLPLKLTYSLVVFKLSSNIPFFRYTILSNLFSKILMLFFSIHMIVNSRIGLSFL